MQLDAIPGAPPPAYGEIHNRIVNLRVAYRNPLGQAGYQDVYDFGLSVGLAEGQASAQNPAAAALALAAMQQARSVAATLTRYGISSSSVPVTSDYPTLLGLRQAWQTTFSQSPAG